MNGTKIIDKENTTNYNNSSNNNGNNYNAKTNHNNNKNNNDDNNEQYFSIENYLSDDKHLVNVNKTLNTDNLYEYAFVMMLSEYIMTKEKNDNRTRNNKNDEDNDDNDNADHKESHRRTAALTSGTNNDTIASLRNDVSNLYREANKMRERKVHIVQIRSIPVSDYWYMLRHYFVRIDELVDVHPGNEQRICLRGWYENTDIGSETLESSYKLCKNCLDESLPKLWDGARKFNFVFQNCDQCCNRSHQSIGIGVVTFLTLSVTLQFLVDSNVTPIALLVLAYVICFVSMYYGHLYADSMIPLIGYNPAVSNRNARSFICRHVAKMIEPDN